MIILKFLVGILLWAVVIVGGCSVFLGLVSWVATIVPTVASVVLVCAVFALSILGIAKASSRRLPP